MLDVSVVSRRGSFVLEAAFHAPGSGITALVGRSGAGKTTLLEVIAGLAEPDDGHVRLDGASLVDVRRGARVPAERRRIGYVFQDARLFPHLDVEDNLRYGLRRAREGAKTVEFDPVVSLLALGGLLGRRPNALSGGEQKRVAIGRALLSQPRLLLLDEPLASLDAERRAEVLPYLVKLQQAAAIPVLYVTHQYEEVLALASQVVLLDAGRVIASGGLESVSLDPALRAIAGSDAIGAVVEGRVADVEDASGLARIDIGSGSLRLATRLPPGARVRLRLLARDLILATGEPHGLSVRNALAATVTEVRGEDDHSDLVHLDIGGPRLVARITRSATRELGIAAGRSVRVLVKSVSVQQP